MNPIVELSDTYSLIKMSMLNNGIIILPKLYVDHATDLPIKLIKIADSMPIMEVGAIYRKGMIFSSAVQA